MTTPGTDIPYPNSNATCYPAQSTDLTDNEQQQDYYQQLPPSAKVSPWRYQPIISFKRRKTADSEKDVSQY
eukprot:CAMPEP_0201949282 /NCGR_PEP_ID=MMETSP0903-20130614/55892_1 /ASSEMBLY_ACC=CAM_ASM_000552 /TAXON_ID=420261 /ORGANISM="Thalassiosira antarctica, Strain CCMP982" /LENGTH=70 /DNA_ID=CAMNT_0048492481 /DNA_START=130 /DNA_END=342 /DNA_ORIENTATION=+